LCTTELCGRLITAAVFELEPEEWPPAEDAAEPLALLVAPLPQPARANTAVQLAVSIARVRTIIAARVDQAVS